MHEKIAIIFKLNKAFVVFGVMYVIVPKQKQKNNRKNT
jgi:hypothetical protein